MKKIFIAMLDMRENMSGVEMSGVARSNVLADILGYPVIYLTSLYNPRLHSNSKVNQGVNRLSPKIKILNMYDHFQGVTDIAAPQKVLTPLDFEGYRKAQIAGKKDYRFYNAKGEFVAFCKVRDEDGSVNFINYLHDGFVFRREHYDVRGFLSRADLMKKADGKEISHELYFRADGSVALVKDVVIEKGVAKADFIQLHAPDGRLEAAFATENELVEYWIEQVVAQNKNDIYIVDRCAEFIPPLHKAFKNTQAKAKLIPVVHSVHTGGDVFDGVVSPFYKAVLEDVDSSDAIVVLTEEQKSDIAQRFGEGNIWTIPHSHHVVRDVLPLEKRNPMKVVYLARYSVEKQHELALKAFRSVVDRVPEAELHLYGFGEKKQAIIDNIKTLNLSDHVFVHDFLHDIGLAYKDAALSIMTSRVEAFCMSIMESLFFGCPVISFDIKYGPKSLIKNGVNGFLVPPNNTDELANRIVQVLKDRALHGKLVEGTKQSVEDLSHEAVARKWARLFESLETRAEDRISKPAPLVA